MLNVKIEAYSGAPVNSFKYACDMFHGHATGRFHFNFSKKKTCCLLFVLIFVLVLTCSLFSFVCMCVCEFFLVRVGDRLYVFGGILSQQQDVNAYQLCV